MSERELRGLIGGCGCVCDYGAEIEPKRAYDSLKNTRKVAGSGETIEDNNID